MVEISQVGIADVLHRLPEVVPWRNVLVASDALDLIICCAGFEDRSISVLNDFRNQSIAVGALITYPTNERDNAPREATFCSSDIVRSWRKVRYDRDSFLHELREVLKCCQEQSSPRVVVDLSAMASYVMYRVLAAVWEVLPNARLAIYYAEADHYFPTEAEWGEFYKSLPDPTDNLAIAEHYEERHFQSRGIDETYDSDVFPGRNIGPLPTSIVAIPTFSLQRMKTMLAFVESQYNVPRGGITWFLGQPPDRTKNGWRYDALAALYNVRSDGIGVSTRDFRDVLDRLDGLWHKNHTEKHLVVAPLGSKMQHLGAFLFLEMHPECGLIVCEPREFLASEYSAGIGPTWWLDFGKVSDLAGLLDSRGSLIFSW